MPMTFLKRWLGRLLGRGRSDDLEALLREQPEPRHHHYLFAHRILPALAREDAEVFFENLSSDRAADYLRDLWHRTGEDFAPQELIAPVGLRAEVTEVGDISLAIIILPPPVGVTEAFFTGASLASGHYSLSNEETEGLRYFTLEVGFTLPGDIPRTVFGEWTLQGHVNYGDGPEPTVVAFTERILRELRPQSATS